MGQCQLLPENSGLFLAVMPRRNGWKKAVVEATCDEAATGVSDDHWRPLFFLVDALSTGWD